MSSFDIKYEFIKMNSGTLNLKTVIGPYTNKRGKTHMAHFTQNGRYYGPCSKYGDVPVEYDGYFKLPTVAIPH
jgi:hypothetical protein